MGKELSDKTEDSYEVTEGLIDHPSLSSDGGAYQVDTDIPFRDVLREPKLVWQYLVQIKETIKNIIREVYAKDLNK